MTKRDKLIIAAFCVYVITSIIIIYTLISLLLLNIVLIFGLLIVAVSVFMYNFVKINDKQETELLDWKRRANNAELKLYTRNATKRG